MRKVLKFKLYPTRPQRAKLEEFIGQARYVYNECLEARIKAYKDEKKSLSCYDQNAWLTQKRQSDKRLAAVPSDVARSAIRRLDEAYKHFFRRCEEGAKKKGFPRFKSRDRYNSFAVLASYKYVRDGHIFIPGIGLVKCRNRHDVTGIQKQLIVVRRAGMWFARVIVADGIAVPEKVPVNTVVGIDLGLKVVVATSDGERVKPLKALENYASKLAGQNKALARAKKGSKRRDKTKRRLQRTYLKLADARSDFAHKLSKSLVTRYDFIAAEKLNITGMVRSRFAKSILDATWGKLIQFISYKAESAGKTFIQVDPRNTSQECSACGALVPKTLSQRVHKCSCRYVADRDVNSAKTVLKRAMKLWLQSRNVLQKAAPPAGSVGVRRVERRLRPACGRASAKRVGLTAK